MAKFEVQIRHVINTGHIADPRRIEWRSVHPTHGLPYRVNSVEEGEEFAAKYYPTCILNEDIRVKKVS